MRREHPQPISQDGPLQPIGPRTTKSPSHPQIPYLFRPSALPVAIPAFIGERSAPSAGAREARALDSRHGTSTDCSGRYRHCHRAWPGHHHGLSRCTDGRRRSVARHGAAFSLPFLARAHEALRVHRRLRARGRGVPRALHPQPRLGQHHDGGVRAIGSADDPDLSRALEPERDGLGPRSRAGHDVRRRVRRVREGV